jgi:hypothetical protein
MILFEAKYHLGKAIFMVDHVANDHVTIFYVDIQKLAFDSPSS